MARVHGKRSLEEVNVAAGARRVISVSDRLYAARATSAGSASRCRPTANAWPARFSCKDGDIWLWQRESDDRWVRHDEDFQRIVGSIERHPVRAGIETRVGGHRWSTAHKSARKPARKRGRLPHPPEKLTRRFFVEMVCPTDPGATFRPEEISRFPPRHRRSGSSATGSPSKRRWEMAPGRGHH